MNVWRPVLQQLGATGFQVNAEWHMTNGAVFFLAIPDSCKLTEDAYAAEVEFPFTLDEIGRMEIPRQAGSVVLNRHFDAISALAPPPPPLVRESAAHRIVYFVPECLHLRTSAG